MNACVHSSLKLMYKHTVQTPDTRYAKQVQLETPGLHYYMCSYLITFTSRLASLLRLSPKRPALFLPGEVTRPVATPWLPFEDSDTLLLLPLELLLFD